MRFGNIKDIYLIVLPLVILIFMILGGIKRGRALDLLNLKNNKKIYGIRVLSVAAGAIFVLISILSPEKFSESLDVDVKGNNIYILMDTSRSMQTEDVYPNRMEKAKIVTSEIIKSLRGDRVGIIPFSDSAYIQMPLTDDYSIGKNYVNAIDTKLISGGGTKILDAIKLADSSFEEIASDKKIVLVISDGGEEEKEILSYVKDKKIIVYSIGVGTRKGKVIPDFSKGTQKGFVKDEKGSIVISKLNTKFLKDISIKSGGNYYEVNNLENNSLNFVDDIQKLDKNQIRKEKLDVYKKYYQIFLFVGIFLIMFGYIFGRGVENEK